MWAEIVEGLTHAIFDVVTTNGVQQVQGYLGASNDYGVFEPRRNDMLPAPRRWSVSELVHGRRIASAPSLECASAIVQVLASLGRPRPDALPPEYLGDVLAPDAAEFVVALQAGMWGCG